MFEQFTIEEINLMCIFDTSSRVRLIAGINTAISTFEEPELVQIAEGTVNKLMLMGDEEFATLELYPVYEDYEEQED